MPKVNLCFCTVFAFFLLASSSFSQTTSDLWHATNAFSKNKASGDFWVRPQKARAFHLNRGSLQKLLQRVPRETINKRANLLQIAPPESEIVLPMPDGSFARFRILESPVMAAELGTRFPEIKTFSGIGIDDPTATIRVDWTPAGLHAQVLSPKGAVYIDPYFKNDAGTYASYYKRDYQKAADGFRCVVVHQQRAARNDPVIMATDPPQSDGSLRTYRLACAATGEYTQFHGGTVAAAMGAIVTAVNRVTGIYEVELAIRLELISNNDLLIYTDANNDPYNNYDGSAMLDQNQANIDQTIGNSNYDIGHVFSTGGGGIAGLAVVCNAETKAEGATGLLAPIGDPFYVDYVAHEMGHQFGANHSFNSVMDQCGGENYNAATAYEPGSGSTLMSYAGICGSDNLQSHSDPYFHSINYEEIINYVTTGAGNSCPVLTSTGNNLPIVNAGTNYTIPKGTPFALTATGSDLDGNTLTYCWEERDLGPTRALNQPDNGSSPLFRSFSPSLSSTRYFPNMADVLSGSSPVGEKLPTRSRVMNFRVTVRDNSPGGGAINTSDTQITVNSNAGPFLVTSSFTDVAPGGLKTITWDVAETAVPPVNATNVNILLSTNGGVSFPIVLATNTPNDGAESIAFPEIFTASARLKIEAVDNIFFDISDNNFSISFLTNLSLSITALPAPVIVEDNLSYSLVVTNAGNCRATNVMVTDFLPSETDFLSANSSVGSCIYTNGTLNCYLGDLDCGQTAAVTITVVPTQVGLITNSASVTSAGFDIFPPDNTNSVITIVAPLPFITNVNAHVRSASRVAITWNTLSNATSQVEYGLTTDYGSFSTLDSTLLTKHLVWLTGLAPDSTYYFRVISKFETNEFKAGPFIFSTDMSIIVDNPQANYSGPWTSDTSAPDKYGGSYDYTSTTADFATSQIVFRPNLIQSGKYDVFLWSPSRPENSTNTQIRVSYYNGNLFTSIDQTINNGSWQLIAAEKEFAAGNSGYVRLSNDTGETNKSVIADAVKWTYLSTAENNTNGIVPTWWANFYFGTAIDTSLDPDGDGYSSFKEYVLGTSPTDSLSSLHFRIEQVPGGVRAIFSPFQAGRLYQLQSSSDFSQWVTVSSFVEVIDGEGVIFQSNPGNEPVFYRLAVQFEP